MSGREETHEYQDMEACVPDFARKFVQFHVKSDLSKFGDRLAFLPTPVWKACLDWYRLPVAPPKNEISRCNNYRPRISNSKVLVQLLPGVIHKSITCLLIINSYSTKMRLKAREGDLIMMNYPHNLGKAADYAWLREICRYAEETIRIFNDGAYAILAMMIHIRIWLM